jgi:class 3 adenylate cyclase/CHASE2 domain-containing sensor protein
VKNDVVIVGFNEETTRGLREPLTLWHPYLGKFLEATAAAGAAAVGLDVVLPDRSYDSIVAGYDRQLLNGLLAARRVMPVVLALTTEPSGELRTIYPAFTAVAGKDAGGYIIFQMDSDGVVRRFTEKLGESGTVPTFAGQLARRLGREAGEGLIDFTAGQPFGFIPLQDVLDWQAAADTDKLQRAFKGKVVLLGGVFRFEDRLAVPVNLAAWDTQSANMPGVLLHAQVLRNLLNDGLIRPVPQWLLVLLCLLTTTLWFCSARPVIAAAAIAGGSVIVLGASTWILTRGWYLPAAAILITLILAVMTRVVYEAALKLRERQKMRRAFAGYVSPGVMDEIMAGQIDPGLGGANKYMCVMFSDIRGYTSRSEGMRPEEIIGFLNRYFEQVVNLIHARGGTVICFMGDGIMAVFGAPKPLDDPCAAAFATARDILAYLPEFNAGSRAAGEAPVEIGIGLHAGEAVVGHVGAAARHDYTAIGDVTNVASRLEGLTKDTGYRLVISKVVADQLRDVDNLVPLGPQAIKGHTPVEVYGYDKI